MKKKASKYTKAQLAKLRVEENERLDRLDTIPLRTLVRQARATILTSPALRGFAIQRTAHEQRCAELGATSATGDMFAAEESNDGRR